MQERPGRVVVTYDAGDALATTHESQGSDMGMKGGLLGYEADDDRLLDPDPHLAEAGIDLSFRVKDTGYKLPNLYLLQLENEERSMEVAAVSTGGGMIEIISINGETCSLKGDREMELWFNSSGKLIKDRTPPEGSYPCIISPLLPTRISESAEPLFGSCREMLEYNKHRGLSAWELAALYETGLAGGSKQEVFHKMQELGRIMREAINGGLKGTTYKDRIYGAQSLAYRTSLDQGGLAGEQTVHNIISYVSAIMEVKSSMGVIVAAPTAGSCGTFPGAILGIADALGLDEEKTVQALLAGSLTGLFIARSSTFSAEIGGCQAECGSASGMAAAGIVSLMGGGVEQAMSAASMALQNSMGMICDPVAARVEAPCLGKNISSALNALACANMALAGYDHLIPLDEVIDSMDRVGRSLPRELRCTALGGLSVTPAARAIARRLNTHEN
jgi:L-serine dehydratase